MENTTLTPKTQAVLDAFTEDNSLHDWKVHIHHLDALAAALRATADQLDHATSAHTLYAIADELEAL